LESLLTGEKICGGGEGPFFWRLLKTISLGKSEKWPIFLRKNIIFDPKNDWEPKIPPQNFSPVHELSKNYLHLGSKS
jgi:hypothetical protein